MKLAARRSLALFGLTGLSLAALAAREDAQDVEYRGQPEILGRDAPRLEEWIPDLPFTDGADRSGKLSEVAGENGLLIVLRDAECPVSQKYGPLLARLEAELAERRFGLLYLGVQAAEAARADAEQFGLRARYAVDPAGTLAAQLAARSTTEVFLLDGARTLVYRGMIDDQYGLGFSRAAARREYLREALAAVEAGELPGVGATQAHGCLLAVQPAPIVGRPNTWNERISRIVQRRCESCHRPGAAGPFALQSYSAVEQRKRMIKFVVEEGIMPPWYAEPGSGPWSNDPSLTPEERADLIAWCSLEAPEGDGAHAPRPRVWAEGWTIGQPDLVVAMPEEFPVPAEGVVDYQFFETALDLPEDRWVQAIEIRPGARSVVHHVILFVDEPGKEREHDGIDGFFAATAPGQAGLRYPAGFAKRLPAKAKLTFQLHYTPSGTAVADRTEVGFVFADRPVRTEVRTASAYTRQFTIPPGAFDYEVSAEYAFPEEAAILSLFPHTHLRGVRFLFELLHPDGKSEELLPLPGYDFNWQLNYDLCSPRVVAAGTRLRATAWYDNTDGNPANPDPTKAVSFGEQTFDEMMIGYVNWVSARAAGLEGAPPATASGGKASSGR